MKTITTLIIAMGLMLGMVPAKKEEFTLTVTVGNLRNENGYIAVALHNGDTDFPEKDAFMSQYVEADGSSIEVVFKNVPAGEYAIAVMHDENGNEDLDFNSYGMPLEGYGFSNEAMGEQGPPDFQDAAFDVGEDTEAYVDLMYMGGF